jgi:hypothetical protein
MGVRSSFNSDCAVRLKKVPGQVSHPAASSRLIEPGRKVRHAQTSQAPEHDTARAWRDDRLNGPVHVGLPWVSLLAFVRAVSEPAVVRHPVTQAPRGRR